MTILIPTVKHTGSYLVLNSFKAAGYEQQPVKTFKPGKMTVVMDHVLYTKVGRMMDIAEQSDAVIIPVRHPLLVAYSWAKQGEEMSPDFYQTWKSLRDFASLDNALLLPLGIDNDEYVEAIRDKTGVRIDVNQIVNTKANTGNLPPDSGRIPQALGPEHYERARELLEINWIAQKFYGEPEEEETNAESEESQPEIIEEAPPPKRGRGRPRKQAVTEE